MRCSACQADNPPQNRFCDNCGTALEASCPSCDAALRPGARFCGACGQRLGETPSQAPVAASPPAGAWPRVQAAMEDLERIRRA